MTTMWSIAATPCLGGVAQPAASAATSSSASTRARCHPTLMCGRLAGIPRPEARDMNAHAEIAHRTSAEDFVQHAEIGQAVVRRIAAERRAESKVGRAGAIAWMRRAIHVDVRQRAAKIVRRNMA